MAEGTKGMSVIVAFVSFSLIGFPPVPYVLCTHTTSLQAKTFQVITHESTALNQFISSLMILDRFPAFSIFIYQVDFVCV